MLLTAQRQQQTTPPSPWLPLPALHCSTTQRLLWPQVLQSLAVMLVYELLMCAAHKVFSRLDVLAVRRLHLQGE